MAKRYLTPMEGSDVIPPVLSTPCDTGAEKALAKAKERGWTVGSMQNDFKMVLGL